MIKLAFFVPEQYLESVKQAVFEAGAGKIGDYDQCCWQTLGQGQFRPLAGSTPFIGDAPKSNNTAGPLARADEYRVEMVCQEDCIKQVVEGLKQAHPYEEPAYEVWNLLDFNSL